MVQVAMKDMAVKLKELEAQNETVEGWIFEINERLDKTDHRLDEIDEDHKNPTGVLAAPGNYIPEWGLEIVEALIEALNGVRLQGAQEYAIALGAKYFPPEGVVEEEETITV